MSIETDLSALIGGCNSRVLPNYVLSRFALEDFTTVEEEFVAQYVESIGNGAERLSPEMADVLMAKVAAAVASGHLSHGSMPFAFRAFQFPWLPFLLWVALRGKHGDKVTRADAAKLITEENKAVVQAAVLRCMHYNLDQPKKKEGGDPNAGRAANLPPDTTTSPQAPTQSTTTSEPSATVDSSGTPSSI